MWTLNSAQKSSLNERKITPTLAMVPGIENDKKHYLMQGQMPDHEPEPERFSTHFDESESPPKRQGIVHGVGRIR